MKNIFLTKLEIVSVRHLRGIMIPLSDSERKHLILTGRNGSGKTSVLEDLEKHLEFIASDGYVDREEMEKSYTYWYNLANKAATDEKEKIQQQSYKDTLARVSEGMWNWTSGAVPTCSSIADLREKYKNGEFILAYYGDNRKFQTELYRNIEKVDFKPYYEIQDNPGSKLAKYLVDLKATQAFSRTKEETETAKKIENWFERFVEILRDIFSDPTLTLDFNINTFQFTLQSAGRDPFDFNTLSSGYAAVLEIVNDLIMRMEARNRLSTGFDLEGIVLIDEIETHLHLELQKKILPVLTKLFPNIQFVLSTHSPFILNSLGNAVIYDLEKKMLVPGGMQNLPYEGIVEGYFDVDRLSGKLRDKYNRYRELVEKEILTDADWAEIDELEYYLDEIPDYLASEITTEYNRFKLELADRG